jgi:hypothetical protein
MTNLTGATAKVVRKINFTREHSIREDEFNTAVYGAMKDAKLEGAPQEVREEVYAKTCLKLVEFFAAGKTLTGKLSSLAYKIALWTAIDTYRRRDDYDKLKASGVDVAEALPEASAEIQAATAEEQLLAQAETALKKQLLAAGMASISETDRSALYQGLTREGPMPRRTPEETRIANAAAQREKRAKERLTRAVREAGDLEM